MGQHVSSVIVYILLRSSSLSDRLIDCCLTPTLAVFQLFCGVSVIGELNWFWLSWLGNNQLTWRRGGYGFFLKKIFRFPMLLKKIFWFWWRKKKIIWFRVFVIWRNVKLWKKNILTLVLSEKNFWKKQKTISPPPPFKLNGRSLRSFCFLAPSKCWIICLSNLFTSLDVIRVQ